MHFPLGIVLNSLATFSGGLLGALLGKLISPAIKKTLPLIFSIGSFGLSINSIIKIHSAAAVIFALLLGSILGITLDLEKAIGRCGKGVAGFMGRLLKNSGDEENERFLELFSIAFILFCTSALGIYGSIHSSLSGDHAILIAKAVLDFFTALLFATSLGYNIIPLAFFQFGIMMFFYLLTGTIAPFINDEMFRNFSGCGGLILLATAFRMAEMKHYPVVNMTPALFLVFPVSRLFSLWGI
jgi:uncharacterized membrane protein YqgA involved in biofilm formation